MGGCQTYGPVWVPIITRHLLLRVPQKGDPNFDSHPYMHIYIYPFKGTPIDPFKVPLFSETPNKGSNLRFRALALAVLSFAAGLVLLEFLHRFRLPGTLLLGP